MVSAQRATVSEMEAMAVHASAWDQIAPGELSFDFSFRPAATTRHAGATAVDLDDKVSSLKDAIIRWLDEQL